MDNEIWKDIPGYEGIYQVSNFGRVKSVERYSNDNKRKRLLKEKILKQGNHKLGYKNIHLVKDGVEKILSIHRLVALAFIPNPDNLPFINHKDENRSNNYLDNLEWCTQKYNVNYGNCINKRKETWKKNDSFLKANETKKKNNSRGHEIEIYSISKLNNEITYYKSICEASRITGILKSHIGECCRGIRKSACGYYWKYK